jgi:hypothetical protein
MPGEGQSQGEITAAKMKTLQRETIPAKGFFRFSGVF